MTTLLLDWTQARTAGPARAGGKGWQLGVLAGLGVAVPDGFVIAAAAGAGRGTGQPVPADVVAALGSELERRGWLDVALAVRSSAALEDAGKSSFAGIYVSCLNVRGLSAVVAAVGEVWDSASSPAALAYKQRLGVLEEGFGMAVVVMPLLPAVAAGIAFTSDPITGREDQLVIHANWGLGEALVSGQAEGDEYRLQVDYALDALTLIGERRGSKARRSEVSVNGRTQLCSMPAELASRAVLSAEQAITLGRLVQDVAFALDYAAPFYDVEWVWDGERFWIVQARPITACGRYTYPALANQPTVWSRGNTRDVVPEPFSPLDWSLSLSFLNRMLTRTPAAAGYDILPGAQRAALHYGRMYLQTSILQWEAYDGFDLAPAVYNQLLGGHQAEIVVPEKTLMDTMVRAQRGARFLLGCVKPRLQAKELFRRTHEYAAAQLARPVPVDNAQLVERLRQHLAVMRTADDLFLLQAAGSALFILLDLLEKHFPGEGQSLTASLMAGGEPSVTAAQAYELSELACVAAADPLALAWLRAPGRVATHWRGLPQGSAFRGAFAVFLQRYGHRAVYESYLRNPRWREAPDFVLDAVLSLIGSNPTQLRERHKKASQEARRRLDEKLPLRYRPLLPLLVRFATAERNLREGARSALMTHLGVIRHYALELGRRLTGLEGFSAPSDVFNLTLLELFAVGEGRMSAAVAARRAAARRERLEQYAAQVAPEVIVENADGAAVMPDVAVGTVAADADQWRGTVVGSGRARGPAHVARHPTEALGMITGAVLVAPSTDPAWTPAFLKAGALVMETGGYISHGAIVARELGIPTVANLPGILEQIVSGDSLEVDGNRGIVRRLPPVAS